MHQNQLIATVITVVIVIVVLGFRMRRMMRATPYNPTLAWIAPAIFLTLSGLALYAAKPTGMAWAWTFGAFAVGGVLGYFRGKSIQMRYDPIIGKVVAQGSATAMLFIVVLIAVRYGLSYWLNSNPGAVGLSPIMANVLPAVMGAGLFVARGYEMGTRGYGILQDGRNAPPAIADAP